MQVQCVHCGKQYSLRDENAGSQFACRSCGKISPIKPGSTSGASPAAPVSPPASEASLIATQCRHCGKQYKLRQAAVGMQFKCKQCGQISPVSATPESRQMIASVVHPQPSSAAQSPTIQLGAVVPAAKPLMAVPVEPVMAVPVHPLSPGSANMLDLLNESSAAPSPFSVSLPPARPTTPKPETAGREKKRKTRSSSGEWSETASRVVGALFCMAIGVGIAALGMWGMQNGSRRAWRTTFAGISIVVLGFLVAIGKYNAD